ncbi:MAG: hypothetical protein AAGN64_02215 [Bacteroidota bacterium]
MATFEGLKSDSVSQNLLNQMEQAKTDTEASANAASNSAAAAELSANGAAAFLTGSQDARDAALQAQNDAEAARDAALAATATSYPIDATSTGADLAVVRAGLLDIVLVGANPATTYVVKNFIRNSAGNLWQVRIAIQGGAEVCQYNVSSNPGAGPALATLTEVGGSGVTGTALVAWGEVDDGTNITNATTYILAADVVDERVKASELKLINSLEGAALTVQAFRRIVLASDILAAVGLTRDADGSLTVGTPNAVTWGDGGTGTLEVLAKDGQNAITQLRAIHTAAGHDETLTITRDASGAATTWAWS